MCVCVRCGYASEQSKESEHPENIFLIYIYDGPKFFFAPINYSFRKSLRTREIITRDERSNGFMVAHVIESHERLLIKQIRRVSLPSPAPSRHWHQPDFMLTDIVPTVPKISNSASVYNVFISFGWTRLGMRPAQQSVRSDNNVPTVLNRALPPHGIHFKGKKRQRNFAKPRKTMSAINRERVNARTIWTSEVDEKTEPIQRPNV